VEVSPCVGEAGRLAVLLHVGEDQDVGVLGMVELVDDVRLRAPNCFANSRNPLALNF